MVNYITSYRNIRLFPTFTRRGYFSLSSFASHARLLQTTGRLYISTFHTQKQAKGPETSQTIIKLRGTRGQSQTRKNNNPGTQINLSKKTKAISSSRVIIEESDTAQAFASNAIQPKSDLGKRIVFYTDATYLNTERIGGMAVAYKHFSDDNADPAWIDKAHGAISLDSCHHAEKLAVCNALEIALAKIRICYKLDDSKKLDKSELPRVMIFTDSCSLLIEIRQYISGRTRRKYPQSEVIFTQLRKFLDILNKKGVYVEFHWVPGHKQVNGNSRAHRLARCTTDALECILPNLPVLAQGQDFRMISIEEIERKRRLARQSKFYAGNVAGASLEATL